MFDLSSEALVKERGLVAMSASFAVDAQEVLLQCAVKANMIVGWFCIPNAEGKRVATNTDAANQVHAAAAAVSDASLALPPLLDSKHKPRSFESWLKKFNRKYEGDAQVKLQQKLRIQQQEAMSTFVQAEGAARQMTRIAPAAAAASSAGAPNTTQAPSPAPPAVPGLALNNAAALTAAASAGAPSSVAVLPPPQSAAWVSLFSASIKAILVGKDLSTISRADVRRELIALHGEIVNQPQHKVRHTFGKQGSGASRFVVACSVSHICVLGRCDWFQAPLNALIQKIVEAQPKKKKNR